MSQQAHDRGKDLVTDANRHATDPEKAATPPVDAVAAADEASSALADQSVDVESTAAALREAVERSHVRDRERVIAGEIRAEDLHFIPVEVAKRSTVHWTDAAVRRFRR